MASLKDKIEAGKEKPIQPEKKKKEAASTLLEYTAYKKTVQMMIRLAPTTHKEFKEITQKQGMTMAATVNMLITKYIAENRSLLDSDN